jgi:hypothetical protein
MSQILKQPIDKLRLSNSFKESSKKMGYTTLEMILNTKSADIFLKEDFNHIWFAELTDFLTENRLLHLLQPPQGNSVI